MCCVSKNNVLWQTYHNTLFFAKKYCVADMAHNTIFLWKNNVLWLKNCQRQSCSAINCLSSGINMLCCLKFVTTHYFLSHNTLFFQKLLCCGHGAQHNIFLEKIMCCDKLTTAQYFFQKILCYVHGAPHNIFWKIMCCDSKSNVLWQTCHNTIFFEKNNVLWQKKIRWQIHATIRRRLQNLQRSGTEAENLWAI